jgi:23S rRNA pseudouridine1911/1915/1917 synthase
VPGAPPFELLLEDGPIIAVNKPAGLLTQGVPHGVPTLEAMVKQYLKSRYRKPGNVYLGIPHRLDRPVSGVIVFARNSKAARRVAEQFQKRQVTKCYWTAPQCPPEPAAGTLTDWLLKLPDEARARIVEPATPGAREASLRYRVIGSVGDCPLVEIELLTGRMHQIRVQFASRGWHIVGDFAYGATRGLMPERTADPRSEPIALHARSLTLLHPIRYDALHIEAPLPENWTSLGAVLTARKSS